MAGMTHEQKLKQTREFMKKLNSRPTTPEQMEYNYWMDDVEAGIYRTQEEKRARLELFRKQYAEGKPMKAMTPDEYYETPEGKAYRKRRQKEIQENIKNLNF